MLDRLFKSFDVVLRQKNSLAAKANQLAQTERQLIDKLSRALASAGYQVVPVSAAAGSRRAAKRVSGKPKTLRCPHCERMFAHPLPMARHIKATHGKKVVRKARRKSA